MDFYYNNERRLRELIKEAFGDEGTLKRKINKPEVDVYKYLIAMSVYLNLEINQNIYLRFKQIAIRFDNTLKTRIFFEKVEFFPKDILYFQDFMKEMSKEEEFLSAYYKFFYPKVA